MTQNKGSKALTDQAVKILNQNGLAFDLLKEYCFLRRVTMYTRLQACKAMGIKKYSAELLDCAAFAMGIRLPVCEPKFRQGLIDQMFNTFIQQDCAVVLNDTLFEKHEAN